MFVGIVVILISLVFFFARKQIGRFQAHTILVAFGIGKHKQPEIAAGLASVWMALSILILTGGLFIVVATLVAR